MDSITLIFVLILSTYVDCYVARYPQQYEDDVSYAKPIGHKWRDYYGLRSNSQVRIAGKCKVLMGMSSEEENALNLVFGVSREQAHKFCIAFFACTNQYEKLEDEEKFLLCKDEGCKVVHGDDWIWNHDEYHCEKNEEKMSEPESKQVLRSYYPYFE